MKVGHLKDTASPALKTFVLACAIVTVGLLFVMEKGQQTRDVLSARGDYSAYLE